MASCSHGLVESSPNFLMEKPRGTQAALCTTGLGQAVTRQSPLGTNQHLISPTWSPHTQESHGSLPREAQRDASRGGKKIYLHPQASRMYTKHPALSLFSGQLLREQL